MIALPELTLTKTELENLDKKVQELKRAFEKEEPALKEIRDFILPYHGKFSGEKANKDGERRDKKILCDQGVLALRTLAAGLQSGVTSPARPWFALKTSDPTEETEEIRIYLEDTQKRMEAVFARSNYYNSSHATYKELGGFATSAMLLEEDYESVIRCRPFTIGEYWLGMNDRLEVDTLARELEMTSRQMLLAFGQEAIPSEILHKVKRDIDEEQKHRIYHLIEPNPKHNKIKYESLDRITPTAYRGVYWLKGYKDRPLKVEGYHEKPFVAPRWDVIADSIYGRGPGWECLSRIKTTNAIEKDFLGGLAKEVNPPLIMPSSMKGETISIVPGGINYYTEGAHQNFTSRIGSLVDVRANLPAAIQKIQINEQKINEFFFADLFAMLSQYDGPKMTAQEVIERHEEKLLILGPVLERLYGEYLNVSIERVYNIMYRNGLLMDPPEGLEGKEIKIEYVSILAQAQRAVRNKSIADVFNFAGSIAQMNPDVLKRLDFQEGIKQYADNTGAPAGIVYGDDVFEKIQEEQRKAEEQAQQMMMAQQANDMAGQAANTIKTLSGADMSSANVLTDLANKAGQVQGLGAVPIE